MRIRLNRRRWTALTIVAFAGLLLTVLSASPTPPAEPPLRGCFDKALSEDSVICYLLEQAQEEEIIDVAAIYQADDDLHYVFLTQTDPVGDKVGEFFRDKAEEFIDSWFETALEEPVPEYLEQCRRFRGIIIAWGARFKSCLLEQTRWDEDDILPYSASYGTILLRPGGADARRSERAGASFTQVWPAAVTPDTSGPFDVSDVDVTNFPEFGCLGVYKHEGRSCKAETNHPKADIAGWEGRVGRKNYIQYKNPPEREEELEALKDTLIPYCDRVTVCTRMRDRTTGEITVIAMANSTRAGTPVRLHGPLADATPFTIVSDDLEHYLDELKRLLGVAYHDLKNSEFLFTSSNPAKNHTKVEIIPVKHNYADLRRYETILDRFIHSRGNTVGILGAEIRDNRQIWSDNALWTPDGPGEVRALANPEEGGDYHDLTSLRHTVMVSAYDSQRALTALPDLLPALGIPVDAVGAVYEEEPEVKVFYNRECDYLIPPLDPFECWRPMPLFDQFLAAVGVPHWVPLWVSYPVLGIVTLTIMGSMVFGMYRLLIRLVRFMRLRRA